MFNMIKKLYLNFNEQKQLLQLAKKINIDFISSAFDLGSLKFLYNDLNLKIIKIPSGEITNFPYLKEIAKKNTKVILSTGLSTLDEIKRALSILTSNKLKKIFQILHCNTAYPTPLEDVNLNVIKKFKKILNFQLVTQITRLV